MNVKKAFFKLYKNSLRGAQLRYKKEELWKDESPTHQGMKLDSEFTLKAQASELADKLPKDSKLL